MSVLNYIRSNLFTVGVILLIAGFSSPTWKSYTVYSSDNITYNGHQGLWHQYLYNDSVSCSGGLGLETDPQAIHTLHVVRNLLGVALGISVLLLVICTAKQCSRDDDADERCINMGCVAMSFVMVVNWTLVLSATLLHQNKLYGSINTGGYQIVSENDSGAFYVMIITVVLFGIPPVIVCDGKLLNLGKTFIFIIGIGLPKIICQVYDAVPEENRARYVVTWLLHLLMFVLFSVAIFSSLWFSVVSTHYSNVIVRMGMWSQCRQQDSLTCCSGITYFYADIPGWFLACRDVTMMAFATCLLAVIFCTLHLYFRTFRAPLLITQIATGILLVTNIAMYVVNVKKEPGVHSHFEDAFILSVVVFVMIVLFIMEFVIKRCAKVLSENSIGNENESTIRTDEERPSTYVQALRQSLISLKERMYLLTFHRRSRRGAQIPVNEEVDEPECNQTEPTTPVIQPECNICMMNPRDTRLHPCGHTCCRVCASSLRICHICRQNIEERQIVFI